MLARFTNWMNKQNSKLQAINDQIDVRIAELQEETERWNDPAFVDTYVRDYMTKHVEELRNDHKSRGMDFGQAYYDAKIEELVLKAK
jgi:hypothetical protein